MDKKSRISGYLWRIVLFLWALTILFPVLWIAYESLKTNVEFFQDVWALPSKLRWVNYLKAWESIGIGRALLNTVFVVGVSLVLGITVVSLKAYALTRLEWKGRKLIWGMIMLSLFLPGVNILVPQYVIMRTLHLTDKFAGLILLYVFAQSVFDLMVLGSFMQSIPKEMEESAFIDGASILAVFRNIILPLSTAGIVTVLIFKFIALYNDFLNPYIYLSDPKKFTIGVNMFHANKMMQYKADWVTLCAGVIINIIPCVIVYVIFQKQIVEGATLGAVKG